MKLKSFLLTSILSLFFVSGVLAQDKYEFAIVKYFPVGNGKDYVIYFSDLKGVTIEEGKVDKNYAFSDFQPLMKYVDNLTNLGWEVFSVTSDNFNNVPVILYHIRKRK